MSQRLVLYLLDGPLGQPLQFWSFEDRDAIRIGRAPENDVVIANPYVSRDHMALRWSDGDWHLTAFSAQGLIADGKKFERLALGHDAAQGFEFQLGPSGPVLRLGSQLGGDDDSTQYQSAGEVPALFIDPERLRREVQEIAGDDFFRRLQSSLKTLRGPSPSQG
jgi:pSer/pThr/pTyr-binding forkhead associated (FHA) protein